LGTGGVFVLAMAIVGDLVSPRERGRYQGYVQGTFALASVAGPIVGGSLVGHVGWRSIFYANLPLGLVALGVSPWTLPFPHPPTSAGRNRSTTWAPGSSQERSASPC